MIVNELMEALADFPAEAEVFAESDQDCFDFDCVEIDENGDVYLTQASLR